MRFYRTQHRHTCGIDLHGRNLYLCVIDGDGVIQLQRRLPCDPEQVLEALEPYRDDLVVGVECTFSWYWLADLCLEEGISFVLGHAKDMKAVHGAKSGNDKLDAERIATLLAGGCFPFAYVYPSDMRPTRDLLRRRSYLVQKRSELLTHIHNTSTQYNLGPVPGRPDRSSDRPAVAEHFPDPCVRLSVQADLDVIDQLDRTIARLERGIAKHAAQHDPFSVNLLKSVPGIGKILSMTVVYEIHDISRFESRQGFMSYARVVRCDKTSNGKLKAVGCRKAGNVHLKWAFSQAATLLLRANPKAQALHSRLVKRHGRPKAMGVLAAKIARSVYAMLLHRQPFDPVRFYAS